MYKHIVSICICLLFYTNTIIAKAEDEKYFILYVEGSIINLTQNKNLKPGDFLLASDQLQFKNNKSRALVISGSRGRFMLKPEANQTEKDIELVQLVKKVLLPIEVKNPNDTRRVTALVSDLMEYFGEDDFFIIGESLSFRLNTAYNPLDANSFLIFSYKYKGETFNKRLPYKGNLISIEKEAIF